MRQADLTPPLGNPGGPCHLIKRIVDEIEDPRLEQRLVREIEVGNSLSNSDAAKVYHVEKETVPGMEVISQMLIGTHAQYRMDLRRVKVTDVQAALRSFTQAFRAARARRGYEFEEWSQALARSESITWTDPRTKLTVAFAGAGTGTVKIVTTFWKGVPDPKLPRPGACTITAGGDVGDISGWKTFLDRSDTSRPSREPHDQALPGGDSRGAPGPGQHNKPPSSEDALQGHPLHTDRTRTLAKPGEQSPHPNPEPRTTPTRRQDMSAAIKGPTFPGSDRQLKQKGQAKSYSKRYYLKNKQSIRRRMKKWYKKNRPRSTFKRDRERRRKYPKRYTRLPGGYSTNSERAKDLRKKKAEDRLLSLWYFEPNSRLSFYMERVEPNVPADQQINRGTDYKPLHHEHEPLPGFEPGQRPVQDNPGSSKVIPNNKDFVNNKAAARMEDILQGCDPQVHTQAQLLEPQLKRVDSKNLVWAFEVPSSKGAPFRVKLKASAKGNLVNLSKMDVVVSCDCPYWQWQGPEHWAKVGGYLYGDPHGTASQPNVKDPQGSHRVCKHVLAVFRRMGEYSIARRKTANVTPGAKRLARRYLETVLQHRSQDAHL